MPWVSLQDYRLIIGENAMAQHLFKENERLRAELAETRAKLNTEIERNRAREERLLDRVLTSRGAYAVGVVNRPKKDKPPSSAIPLTALEEAELKMYIESAAEQGFGPDVARRMFERDRRRRLEPDADLSMYKDLPVIKEPEEINDEEEEEGDEESKNVDD